MATQAPDKKRIVISYHNLSPELQARLKEQYPAGFSDHMIRIDRAPGSFFYAVVLDTEQVRYLVKVDVKIDDRPEEEEDKEYYDEDIKGAEEIADEGGSEDSDDE